ncbi:MAG: hypothetical protein JO281_08030 [Pseudonocardiales bacterium]|nr:hypothetical protein [Pseudonocardiales bacterium]
MATTTESTVAVAGVSFHDVWLATVRGLGEVRVLSEAEVLAEAVAHGGDLVIKSKEAEPIISLVEERVFGGVELADQSHLGHREKTSLRALADLLWQRWVEVQEGAGT